MGNPVRGATQLTKIQDLNCAVFPLAKVRNPAPGATQLTAKKDLRCVEFLIALVGQHFITLLLLLLLSLFLSNKFVHTK